MHNPNTEIIELAHRLIELTGRSLFITGKAGSGKTYFLNEQSKRTTKSHIIVAPTGIAAVNAGGVTINSLFQIPPGTYIPDQVNQLTHVYSISGMVDNLNYTLQKRKLLQNLELIFIDEASMLRSDQLSVIDAILKKVRNNNLPFGGIQMIFIGDLFQLPPILPNELVKLYSRYYQSEFFFDSPSIKNDPLIQIELPFVHRQSEESFINLLNRVRTNTLTTTDLANLNERMNGQAEERFVIHITSHVEDAVQFNSLKLNELSGEIKEYPAIINGEFKDANTLADKVLRLKKGAQVMVIRNDSKSLKDYYNGKTGEVVSLGEHSIQVRFEDGKEVEVKRATWQSLDYVASSGSVAVTGELKQFPLKLAWAITIHKSQGLTFERAMIDASKSFAPGQVYVALSRVKSFSGLRLKTKLTIESIRVNPIISTYLNISSLSDLGEVLESSKVSYWLNQLMKQFDLTSQREEILDVLNRPNTYKQKIDTQVLLSFQDIEATLAKLQLVWAKFSSEVFEKFHPKIDNVLLEDRIAKAIKYFIDIINPIVTKLSTNLINTKDLSRSLVDTINASLNKKMGDIRKTGNWVMIMASKGLDEAIAESRIREAVQSAPELHQVTPTKKKNANNSVKQTIELFLSGQTMLEISKSRNLSIGTVENHLLEASKTDQRIATLIMQENDLAAIQSKILEIGSELLDLKEFFGEQYTFFQLRLAIAHAQLGANPRG